MSDLSETPGSKNGLQQQDKSGQKVGSIHFNCVSFALETVKVRVENIIAGFAG